MAPSLTDKQFEAGVRVIQNLPKDGSFKPSNELLLKFYAYYKQGTIGKCNISKPSMFNLVAKAKWEAWNSLGNMECLTAKQEYVDLLKEIIETMPQSGDVGELMEVLGPFYELVDIHTGEPVHPDQANGYVSTAAPPAQPNGEHLNGGSEPERPASSSGEVKTEPSDSHDVSLDISDRLSSSKPEDTRSIDSDTDSEVFVDSSDVLSAQPELPLPKRSSLKSTQQTSPTTNGIHSISGQSSSSRVRFEDQPRRDELDSRLQEALHRVRLDLQNMEKRVELLEQITCGQRQRELSDRPPDWWPLRFIRPQTAALVLLWPVLVVWITNYLQRRRR